MRQEYDMRSLPIVAFARAAGRYAGEVRLSAFSRLLQESRGLGGETWVTFEVQGFMEQDAAGLDEPWIRLQAQTTLAMTCQRCLGPAELPVEFEREFRFVATEALAEVEDEESEEDVLVISKSFDLLELIEDELLMALPVVPKHEQCPQPVKFEAADADFETDKAENPNPFAVLQKLKGDGIG